MEPDASRRPITVGGLPGTGTTTVCIQVAPALGLEHHYAGRFFRDMAKERGLTLQQLGAAAESDASIDREVDRRQMQWLRSRPAVLEGRLSGFLADRDRVDSYKVWFVADSHERARRIADREGTDPAHALQEMQVRERSERRRYQAYYDFDLRDDSIYDLVIDTTHVAPPDVARRIVDGYRAAGAPRE